MRAWYVRSSHRPRGSGASWSQEALPALGPSHSVAQLGSPGCADTQESRPRRGRSFLGSQHCSPLLPLLPHPGGPAGPQAEAPMLGAPGCISSGAASYESSSGLGVPPWPACVQQCPDELDATHSRAREGEAVASGEVLVSTVMLDTSCAQLRLWSTSPLIPGVQGPVSLCRSGDYEYGRRREGCRFQSQVALGSSLASPIHSYLCASDKTPEPLSASPPSV